MLNAAIAENLRLSRDPPSSPAPSEPIGKALSREEIVRKLNSVPTFCLANADKSIVGIENPKGGEMCCWFVDAAEARAWLELATKENPDVRGLHLGVTPLGIAFSFAAGWAPVCPQFNNAPSTSLIACILPRTPLFHRPALCASPLCASPLHVIASLVFPPSHPAVAPLRSTQFLQLHAADPFRPCDHRFNSLASCGCKATRQRWSRWVRFSASSCNPKACAPPFERVRSVLLAAWCGLSLLCPCRVGSWPVATACLLV